jgi:phage terminase large subunit
MTLYQKNELYNLLIQENRLRIPEKLQPIWDTKKRYIALYGGRGGAKSVSVSKLLLHRATEKRRRVLCTREIQNSIKDSVHSSLKDLIFELKYDCEYKVTENGITHKRNKSDFIFMGLYLQDRKQSIKSYANVDICWVEEAQSVSEGSLKILDPTIRKKGSQIIFTFNRFLPDDPVWKFLQRIPDEEKLIIHINYDENPYLTEVLLKQALRSKKEYEEGLNINYPHVWGGEPEQYGDRTIIPYKSLKGAINRTIDNIGQEVIGVDVARFGSDNTVFFKRKGLKVIEWKSYAKTSIDEVCDLLIEFTGRLNTHIPIKIDDTGVGGGVTDFMKRYGYNVVPVNFNQVAQDQDLYNNAISEMWFTFRDKLDEVCIPDIQELNNQLLTREYKFDNKQRRQVQSKDEYKKKYQKSPDFADALLLCYYDVEDVNDMYDLGDVI